VRKGSYEGSVGSKKFKGEVEFYEKRPDKSLFIVKVNGRPASKESYDGMNGWLWGAGEGAQPAAARQLEIHRRTSAWDLADINELKKVYVNLTVRERRKLDDHEVFVVEASLPDGKIETIYFDCQTKLAYRYDLITDSVSVQQGVAFPTQIYLD